MKRLLMILLCLIHFFSVGCSAQKVDSLFSEYCVDEVQQQIEIIKNIVAEIPLSLKDERDFQHKIGFASLEYTVDVTSSISIQFHGLKADKGKITVLLYQNKPGVSISPKAHTIFSRIQEKIDLKFPTCGQQKTVDK